MEGGKPLLADFNRPAPAMLKKTPIPCPIPMALATSRLAIFVGVQEFIDHCVGRMEKFMKQRPGNDMSYFIRVLGAVIVGHCEAQLGIAHAKTKAKVAHYTGMPERTASGRLKALLDANIIVCIDKRYYLAPKIASETKQADGYMKIFDHVFDGIEPELKEYQRKKKKR